MGKRMASVIEKRDGFGGYFDRSTVKSKAASLRSTRLTCDNQK